MKEKVKEPKVEKKEKVAYFTDEMHRNTFAFPDGYKQAKGGKAVMGTIKLGGFKN